MSDNKSVRLNKLVKEFNVSIDRIYSFLEAKGIEDLKPNTKVSHDVYMDLLREFDSEKKAKLSADLLAKEKKLTTAEEPMNKVGVVNATTGKLREGFFPNGQTDLSQFIKSKKQFINRLNKKRSTFHDPDQAEMISNLLDTVSSDIYSESQRFIFELIQNADDSASGNKNDIHFNFEEDCLIISHNGKPFNEEDIKAVTHAGKGTKKSDQSKTGYKGIGFKSVFGKSDKVYVFSDGYNFRFDRKYVEKLQGEVKLPWQIIPIWTDKSELPISVLATVSKNFSVSTIIELNNTDSLLDDLNELISNGEILLFLRRIVKISVSIKGEHQFTLEKEIVNKNKCFNETSIQKNNKEISRWIVKVFEKIPIDIQVQSELLQDNKTPDKLKKAKFTEISFAARIKNGKIKTLKSEESLVFTYLPTKVSDFEFPFLVNGNFLTNASREAIHEDRFWNQWLFEIMGEKLFDWFELLSSTEFRYQILHLLPSKFNSSQNELKIAFDKTLSKVGESKSFIPNKSCVLRKASDILIDKTGISKENFILESDFIDFINKTENISLDSESFIHPELELDWKLKGFGSTTFDMDNIEEFFTDKTFTKTHDVIRNFALISYFFDLSKSDKSKQLNEKLKNIPFIFANGEKLKSPQTLCFPSVDYETEYGEGVSVIHTKVYPKIEVEPKVKRWLENLGIKEPSDLAYIENEIIGNIEEAVNKSNYLKVTRSIFDLHKKGLLDEEHYEDLQDLKVFTTNGEFSRVNQSYLSDIYDPIFKIEKINKLGSYVSGNYLVDGDLKSEWKTFFLKIGVSENISLQLIKTNVHLNDLTGIESSYFIEMGESAKENHSYPHLVSSDNDIILDKIRFSEFANIRKFSIEFWKSALVAICPKTVKDYALMPWGYYGSNERVGNYFQWSLMNSRIFPTSTKECLKANEVFVNLPETMEVAGNFLPVFDCETIPNEEWLKLIPFKGSIELEDYLTILEGISKEKELTKVNKKRIGLIYNYLSKMLINMSETKKMLISQWSGKNLLLSFNNKFVSPKELNWIKISGFTNSSDKIKVLFIPDNCNVKNESFQELLSLFGIQIIDDFIPEFKNVSKDTSLKKQLQLILPYLVAFIEKKQFGNFSADYQRMSKIIDDSEFLNSSEITLSFKNQGTLISGPTLNAYLYENKLYFKGRWQSPMIMYSLVPELAKLLGITDMNEELNLILQLDEMEIKDWFIENRFDLSELQESPEYLEYLEKLNTKIPKESGISEIAKNKEEANEETEQSGKQVDIINPNDISEHVNDDEDNKQELYKVNFNDLEIEYLESVITGDIDFSSSAQEDINKNAIFRSLLFLRDEGYGIPEETLESFLENNEKQFIHENGEIQNFIIRSAAKGVLFLDPSSWEKLNKEDVSLLIYEGGEKVTRKNTRKSLIEDYTDFNKFGLVRVGEDFDFGVNDFDNLLFERDDEFDDNKYDKYKLLFLLKENQHTQTFIDIFKEDGGENDSK
jgi:hypothetical protein|tara:strand:- start:164 stop:4594 length:4431 start_codon:yes stop_codon:yes gene_type:complete